MDSAYLNQTICSAACSLHTNGIGFGETKNHASLKGHWDTPGKPAGPIVYHTLLKGFYTVVVSSLEPAFRELADKKSSISIPFFYDKKKFLIEMLYMIRNLY